MKILPCERRDSCADFSRLRSSQLNNIELPIHMIPAIRCAQRNTTSNSSFKSTPAVSGLRAQLGKRSVELRATGEQRGREIAARRDAIANGSQGERAWIERGRHLVPGD